MSGRGVKDGTGATATAAGAGRGRRSAVPVVVTVLVALLALGLGAWELWWPTNVDRRALDRIGPPVAGASATVDDYVSEGNVLCFDVCTRLTRVYTVPDGTTVGTALAGAATAARSAGYPTLDRPSCFISDTSSRQFTCQVTAQGSDIDVNIDVTVVGPEAAPGRATTRDSVRQPRAETLIEQVAVSAALT